MLVTRKGVIAAASATVAALAIAPAAPAAPLPQLRTISKTLRAGVAVNHVCTTRAFTAQTRGVAQTTYRAPIAGYATVRLLGSDRSDWDLGLYDAKTRMRGAGSTTFGSHETAQAWVDAGQRLLIQACRRSGRSASVPMTIDLVVASRPLEVRKSHVTIHLSDARRQLPQLEALNIDLGEDIKPTSTDAVVTAPDLSVLSRLGFGVTTMIADLARHDRAERAKDARAAQRAATRADEGNSLPSGRTTYRMYEDYGNEMKALVAKYPNLMKPFKMPESSFQDREVDGIELTDNVNAPDDGRPTFVVVAMHHAREWPAAEMGMELLYYLGQKFGSDPRVTKILQHERIFIVPLINPDGYIESRSAPEELEQIPVVYNTGFAIGPYGGGLAYRRKNCGGAIPSGLIPCTLQYGIDPNRNYGQYWGGRGAGTQPTDQTYRGTGPWSEPETKSFHEFSQEHGNMVTLITMHNFAALVLRPPGVHDSGPAPDEPALKKLGDAMGKATGYTSEYGYQLYDTTGTTEDWNYAANGTFGYTIEMAGQNFHDAYQFHVIDQWTGGTEGRTKGKGLREAYLAAADEALDTKDHSVLTGRSQPGRTLRITKKFQTETSQVCTFAQGVLASAPAPLDCAGEGTVFAKQAIDDHVTATMTVPADGHYTWHIEPSTRPFVAKSGKTEAWTLTCEDPASKQALETQQLTIARGEQVKLDLPCGAPLPPEPVAAPVVTKKKHLTKAQKCRHAKTKKAKRKYCKKKKRAKKRG